jgi:SAM-dependent methyltransferase
MKKKLANTHKHKEYCQKIIRKLYKQNNAKEISLTFRKERKKDQTEEKESDAYLTYGEIDPVSFIQLLETVSGYCSLTGKVFYDLGSGSGLACLTAALSPFSFRRVVGIEIVPELAELSQTKLSVLREGLVLDSEPGNVPTVLSTGAKANMKCSSVTGHLPSLIVSILNESNGEVLVELLANRVCTQVGHKRYRDIVKPFKTFLRLLQSLEFLSFSVDEKTVSLKESSPQFIDESPVLDEKVPVEDDSGSGVRNLLEFHLENDVQLFYKDRLPEIELFNDDIFCYPWWETADIIYVASLLFSDKMMEELSFLVVKMKKNSFFVTLKPLIMIEKREEGITVNEFQLIHESFFKMSWQMAKVYMYKVV